MPTQRYKPRLYLEWVLEGRDGASLPMGEILRLLAAIEEQGHIAGACAQCGLSYRHAWGILRRAEAELRVTLIETSRRRGSRLTGFARHLLWANRRIDARLAPTFESIASELQEELRELYAEKPHTLRLHASHGFAVEGLMRLANGGNLLPLELRYRTAVEALASLARGECDLAGFQVPVETYEQAFLQHYAPWLDPDRMLLIHLAQRNTGLIVQQGNPKAIRSLHDFVRPDVRFVNRQLGSSTRLLVQLMLERLGIDPGGIIGFDSCEFTHLAIAAHIASGMADVGIGVQTAALRCGLDFIPLVRERYFFGINQSLMGSDTLQRLLELMQGQAYQAYTRDLDGYDCRSMGKVLTLDQAFGQEGASPAPAGGKKTPVA
jgi:molybdate transport repressor ModE-like protein